MKNEDKIIDLIKKNNGCITTREVNLADIPKVTLTRLVKKGIIKRQKKDYMVFQMPGKMNILVLHLILKMRFFPI